MAGDLDVAGTEQLKVLGAKLKVADKQLRLRMSRNMRAATKPLVAELRVSAGETLPGALGARVARSTIGTRITTSGNKIGVRVRGKNAMAIASMNAGRVRAPLFGNRKWWYTHSVTPGWWDKPFEDPELVESVNGGIQLAMDETAKELTL